MLKKKFKEKDKKKTNQWPAGVVDHNQWKKSIAFFYIYLYIFRCIYRIVWSLRPAIRCFSRAYLMTDLIIINHIGAIEIQIKEFLFYFPTDIRESSTFASMKLARNIMELVLNEKKNIYISFEDFFFKESTQTKAIAYILFPFEPNLTCKLSWNYRLPKYQSK